MLSFDYTMELDFEGGMAREHAFTLRCLPQQTVNQKISDLNICLEPQTPLFYGTDGFGTRYCYGVVHAAHSRFRVEVSGMAERFSDRHAHASAAQQMLYRQFTSKTMPGAGLRKIAGELQDVFRREGLCENKENGVVIFSCTGVDAADAAAAANAGESFTNTAAASHAAMPPDGTLPAPGTGVNPAGLAAACKEATPKDIVWQQAQLIRDMVYTTMTYVPGATNPATSAEEAAGNRKGVCQDYAHIMLTLCRMFHIPCRYTAGLLLGEGKSHAWVEVCDHGNWRELDPTNPGASSSDRLIFSHGRDAADCEINRGIYLGPSAQLQKVTALLQKCAERNSPKMHIF